MKGNENVLLLYESSTQRSLEVGKGGKPRREKEKIGVEMAETENYIMQFHIATLFHRRNFHNLLYRNPLRRTPYGCIVALACKIFNLTDL